MGLINPPGTAITVHPFGRQAGLASSLLGFMQKGCAAIGASLASALPAPPFTSLAVILAATRCWPLWSFFLSRCAARQRRCPTCGAAESV